jgi:hypothetical protein
MQTYKELILKFIAYFQHNLSMYEENLRDFVALGAWFELGVGSRFELGVGAKCPPLGGNVYTK